MKVYIYKPDYESEYDRSLLVDRYHTLRVFYYVYGWRRYSHFNPNEKNLIILTKRAEVSNVQL